MSAAVSIERLAAELGVSASTIQRLRRLGLPSIPAGPRTRRYDPDACKAWLQSNEELVCPSSAPRPVAMKSPSASAASAFTDVCRQVQVRVMPSARNPNCG